MTEVEVRAAVRYLLNELDTNVPLDTSLDIPIQSALESFNRRTGYRLRTDSTSITLVSGTQTYTVPANVDVLLVVEWNGKALQKADIFDWRSNAETRDWRSRTGQPEEWSLLGRQLLFRPIPNAESVAAAANPFLWYIGAVGTFGDTELAFIGAQDHRILAYGAAAEWLSVPGNNLQGAQHAPILWQRFEAETSAVAERYAARLLQQ